MMKSKNTIEGEVFSLSHMKQVGLPIEIEVILEFKRYLVKFLELIRDMLQINLQVRFIQE